MHQQDVSPNLANRILAPTGNPHHGLISPITALLSSATARRPSSPAIRFVKRYCALPTNQVKSYKASFNLDPTQPLLLVTGGSQGSRHLNHVVVARLSTLLPRCQILHISGEHNYEETRQMAEPQFAERPELRGRYMLRGYLSTRMAEALAASDVLLCRSGAATLSELAVLGRPSILVPLPPGITGSPQATNAAMFRQAVRRRGDPGQGTDGRYAAGTR